MYIIKISDWSNYDSRLCRNGGQYAFFEEATVKGGKIVDGKHSTSAEFDYCPHCGRFEQRMDDHLERFCYDGEYIPSLMMEGIAKEIIAGASPDDINVEEGIEIEAMGANEELARGARKGKREMKPEIGDMLEAPWPGEDGAVEFSIADIRPDKDGVMCVVFGKDGIVGVEAVVDLLPLFEGHWIVVAPDTAAEAFVDYVEARNWMDWLSHERTSPTGIGIDNDFSAQAWRAWRDLSKRLAEQIKETLK